MSAGCTVLVVPNHVPVPSGAGRIFADTLEHMTLADLRALQQS